MPLGGGAEWGVGPLHPCNALRQLVARGCSGSLLPTPVSIMTPLAVSTSMANARISVITVHVRFVLSVFYGALGTLATGP